MNIGDEITFGKYAWRVLDIQDGAALVITQHVIFQRAYHTAYEDAVWANCALRSYLNGEFYNAFSGDEKARIKPVVNQNPDNQWYGTPGGEPSEDKVFLLSIEEVACKYFGDSSANLYSPKKNKRYWFERKDANNSKRTAYLENEEDGVWWWWLRSPGRMGVKAAYVHGDGNIGIQGNNILKSNVGGPFNHGDNHGGVRPALWLKL